MAITNNMITMTTSTITANLDLNNIKTKSAPKSTLRSSP